MGRKISCAGILCSLPFMASDTGILCCTEVYGSGQEADSSLNGQPSDAGMP